MRKRLLVVGAAALIALTGAAVVVWVSRPRGESFGGAYDRIRPGMTSQEVRALMGQPSSSFFSPGLAADLFTDPPTGAVALVSYDSDERVVGKQLHAGRDRSWQERLLAPLHKLPPPTNPSRTAY